MADATTNRQNPPRRPICVRLTDYEIQALHAEARRCGTTLTEEVRRRLFRRVEPRFAPTWEQYPPTGSYPAVIAWSGR